MWLFDAQTVTPAVSFWGDLWHAFLVFLAMFVANHASGNTSNGSK